MRVLLTGAAGFIGYHTAKALLDRGHHVCGYDNVNDYYDPMYKQARLEVLSQYDAFAFHKADLVEADTLTKVWKDFEPDHCIHLAAQAGVRYSIQNPHAYIDSNIVGFQNVLELVREHKPQNFVYASSSSVYGGNQELPFSETQRVDNPISLYAATKVANEVFARTYNNLYGVKSTGLRFFTVYGPIARPDMAIFKFAELMRVGKPIPVFNQGHMVRDFTYVDDIVDGILRALAKPEDAQVYNLGKGSPEKLQDMIEILEGLLGIKAEKDLLPMQLGDVPATQADISRAREHLGYDPKTSLREGMEEFCKWYRDFWSL